MLITPRQLNTFHYNGGLEAAGPTWCPGSAQSLTSTSFLVQTGVSGCGAAPRGYRRSFFSVRGLAVALLADH